MPLAKRQGATAVRKASSGGSRTKSRSHSSSGSREKLNSQIKKIQKKYRKLKKKYRLLRSIPPVTTERYTYEATVFAHAYDFTPVDLRVSRAAGSQAPHGPYRTALWFLPYFETPFYGGVHTILRFADFLQRRYGIRSSFAIVGTKDTSPISASIQKAFPGLAGNPVYPLPNIYRFDGLPDHDLGICTLWTTAYSLLKFNRVRRKLYFMQDYEPYFYPSGSTSSQVIATYRFGFDGICNTPALLASYEGHGGRGAAFTPAVNRAIFYPDPALREAQSPGRLFVYARPGTARNCFELASAALRKLKETLGAKVDIVSAGAEWDVTRYGLQGIVRHLGMLPYEQTGQLYRTCRAGLALMSTRHPSYPPLELMACGSLVVTNNNEWNQWLFRHGENCLLSEPSATCLYESLYHAVTNRELRERITTRALEYIRQEHSDWDGELQRTAEALSIH